MTAARAAKKPPTTKRGQERAAANRFVRSRKVYVLTFDDPDLEGLEVRARSLPLGRFLQMLAMYTALEQSVDEFSADELTAIQGLFEGFASALVSWNLDERTDDEIVAVPATLAGVMDQDTDFMLQLISAWMEAMGAVDVPLGPGSSGGDSALEASLPMAAPLLNPAS